MERVTVQLLARDDRVLELDYGVVTRGGLALPPPVTPVRTDGLWQETCFEAFFKSASSDAYLEFNFSPSFAWAAYAFEKHRTAMRPLEVWLEPEITVSIETKPIYSLTAEFGMPQLGAGPLVLNASAVIEETDGTKSYWALAHPPEGPPDFHHPSCFMLELPPAPPA